MAAMAVTGNVIPATWYKTITTPSGKADLVAINILSDVLYWYRPREVRDEYTGDVVAYQKRFAADYLQRSYEQLSEHFGTSSVSISVMSVTSLIISYSIVVKQYTHLRRQWKNSCMKPCVKLTLYAHSREAFRR